MEVSPSTQRTASDILLFPEPFGPTTAVIPFPKFNSVLSGPSPKGLSIIPLKLVGYPKPFKNKVRAEKTDGNTVIFNDTADEKGSNEREAVYIYYAKYDESTELTPLEDLLKMRGTISDFNSENAKTEQIGAKLYYETYSSAKELTADSYIFTDDTLDESNAKKIPGYEYRDLGYYNVLIKK